MKKYINPQIETEKLEATDIITASNIFFGFADLDKSESMDWSEDILDPKDAF